MCNHTIEEEIPNPMYDEEYEEGYGIYGTIYEPPTITIETSAFKDIDLHRMKCKLCGKIEYYSQRAKEHYENGIDHTDVLFPKNI